LEAFSTGLTVVEILNQWDPQGGSTTAAENALPAPVRTLTLLKSLFSVKRMHLELRTVHHLQHKAITLL